MKDKKPDLPVTYFESVLMDMLSKTPVMQAPRSRTYVARHYDLVLPIGADHSVFITFDEEALRKLCERTGLDAEKVLGGQSGY